MWSRVMLIKKLYALFHFWYSSKNTADINQTSNMIWHGGIPGQSWCFEEKCRRTAVNLSCFSFKTWTDHYDVLPVCVHNVGSPCAGRWRGHPGTKWRWCPTLSRVTRRTASRHSHPPWRRHWTVPRWSLWTLGEKHGRTSRLVMMKSEEVRSQKNLSQYKIKLRGKKGALSSHIVER